MIAVWLFAAVLLVGAFFFGCVLFTATGSVWLLPLCVLAALSAVWCVNRAERTT